jgi:general stress protein 26
MDAPTPTQKIYNLLAKFNTAMLVTQGRDLTQHARPRAVAKIEANCDVWFFTARSSVKVHEIELDQKVLLLFQGDHNCYVSLAGRAELISDHVQMAAMWRESGKIWFPNGVKDPNPILIRVASEEADYWDASGLNGIKYFFAITKARLAGKTSPIDISVQHGHEELKRHHLQKNGGTRTDPFRTSEPAFFNHA